MSYSLSDLGNPAAYSNIGTYGYGGTYPTNFSNVSGPGLSVQGTKQFGQTGLDWSSPTALGYSMATGHSPGTGSNPIMLPLVSTDTSDPITAVSDWISSLSSGAKLILLGGLGIVVLSYAMKFKAR